MYQSYSKKMHSNSFYSSSLYPQPPSSYRAGRKPGFFNDKQESSFDIISGQQYYTQRTSNYQKPTMYKDVSSTSSLMTSRKYPKWSEPSSRLINQQDDLLSSNIRQREERRMNNLQNYKRFVKREVQKQGEQVARVKPFPPTSKLRSVQFIKQKKA